MRIQLLTDRVTAGATNSDGDVIDVSTDEALRMIESGQAIVAGELTRAETDALEEQRTQVRTRTRKKGKFNAA